jgi:glycosyltransferase involved in cell wall biosynthesis
MPMNVLVVIHYPVFGGPHNQALLLASSLSEYGVATTVLLPGGNRRETGNATQRLRDAGVDVVAVGLDRVRATVDVRRHALLLAHAPRDVAAIRKVVRARRIDVVQVSGLVNPHAAVAARLERVPVVWQLLDTRPPMTVRRLLMPVVLALSDIVMSTGRAVADVHPGAGRLGERLHVFFPPVDPEYFDPTLVDHEAARGRFGFSQGDLVLGTVGNLNPQKGHEYLLRAAGQLRRVNEKVKVLVVGASHDTHRSYEEELRRLSASLDLSVGRDVVFAGGLGDVRPALAAMDVFVLASVRRSEGAPTAIEEAMMMSVPVVATAVGSVREVVDDGETGFVVQSENSAALAAAIRRIIENPTMREHFGPLARERALERFSAEECARAHVGAYRHALARHARKPRAGGRR